MEELRSLFPPALIGDSGWERVQALTTRLPIYTTESRFGFEFDLCDPSPTADFAVFLAPRSRLAAFYEQQTEETAPGLIGPGFGPFLREQGRDPQSLFTRTGAGVILEYDLATPSPGQHSPPGIFIVTLDAPEQQQARLHDEPTALVAALESAAGWGRGVVDIRQVDRVRAAVADAGIVAQAGVMPGRDLRAIRLIIQGVGNANVADMLKRLQWNGDPSLAVSALSDLTGLVKPQTGLSIDVTSQGVSSAPWPRAVSSDSSGTKRIAPDGNFCSTGSWRRSGAGRPRPNGLAEWPGIEIVFGRDGVYKVRQTVNHIKLVIDRGAVRVKGYAAMDMLRTAP